MILRALAGASVALAVLAAAWPAGAEDALLRVVRVPASAGPLTDPGDGFWNDAPSLAVAMEGQVIATPAHPDPAIKELSVRAAHNGQWIAFLIEWADPTKSDRIVLDTFGDQVAVELPVRLDKDNPPSPMMGGPDGRVSIMQWRAAFQRDIDEGQPSVRDLYPNAQVDIYPDQVLRATDARPYMGAIGVDNPISHPNRTPVLDQMAEGWGTLTVKTEQHADGRGVWRDGRWRVVITHPLATESESEPRLLPGDESLAAFAVWEGGNREVGARKAWSNWVPLKLDQ